HLSLLKGGQLARAAAPATVLTLALSDVIGNAVDVIASGPTAPDPSTYAQALAVVRRFGLEGRGPRSVLDRLEAGAAGRIPETPKPDDKIFARVTNLVIGDNSLFVAAAAARAAALGYAPGSLPRALRGEARGPARARGLPASGPAFVARGQRLARVLPRDRRSGDDRSHRNQSARPLPPRGGAAAWRLGDALGGVEIARLDAARPPGYPLAAHVTCG